MFTLLVKGPEPKSKPKFGYSLVTVAGPKFYFPGCNKMPNSQTILEFIKNSIIEIKDDIIDGKLSHRL